MSERHFARVYYDDLILEFPAVYTDDALLATWVRLLILAEKMWPTLPEIPRSVRIKTYQRLVESGLVIPADGMCYRIRGLDAERTRRADAGRKGAAVRWQSERNANAYATAMPRRDKTRREEDEYDGRADLEAFLLVRRRAPTAKQRKLLDEILDRHDVTGPAWAADIILRNPDDPIGAVLEADRAWREQRIADAIKAEKPKPRAVRSGGLPASVRETLAAWSEAKKDDAA